MADNNTEAEALAKNLDECAREGVWSGHFTIKTATQAAAALRSQAQEIARLRGEVERYTSTRDHMHEALDATARQEISRLRAEIDECRRQSGGETHVQPEQQP